MRLPVGGDRRLGELSQLPAVDERLEDVLLDVRGNCR